MSRTIATTLNTLPSALGPKPRRSDIPFISHLQTTKPIISYLFSMKKFLLTTLLVLVTVVAAFAETVSVDTNKNSKPPYTLKSGSQDIVNITTEKGTATSDISYNKTTQMVMYSGNILKFSMVDGYVLEKVKIECSSSEYVIQTTAKWDVEGGTASLSNTDYTWTAPASANVSAASLTMDGTYRLKTITVTYAKVKEKFIVTNSNVVVTYNPASPKLDLSENLPAEILETATLTFTGAEKYINREGIIIASNADAAGDQTVNVAWTETATYKANNHDFTFLIDKAEPALAYSAETATATMGETAELPTLSNPYNLKLRYSSSKRAVAEIDDNTGAVTILAPGTALIGAFFDGNDLFNSGSDTYTLTVQEAGLPAAPVFSFDNEGTYTIDQKLSITTATEDAEIFYRLDGENYIKYEGEISFDKAGAYTVWAYAKNAKGPSTTAKILFTVEMLKYDFAFAEVAEQMVGRDRYFAMPKLEGAEGMAVKYTILADDGVLLSVPGEEGKYFIIGAGDVIVTAEIAGNANYADFSKETTVKVVPQVTKIETTKEQEFDFTDYTKVGFTQSDVTTSGNDKNAIVLDKKSIVMNGVTLAFENNDSPTNVRIFGGNGTGYLGLYRYNRTNKGNGCQVKISANGISKVELTVNSNDTEWNVSAGTLSDLNNKVRTWTPKDGEVVDELVVKNVGTSNPQITSVKVYYTEVTEGEPATAYDLKFDKKIYEFEVGDKLPVVNVPDGYTATYVLNGETIVNPDTFVFTKDLNSAELYAYAFTDKDDEYLPAVAYAIADVKPIILPGHLTIHYSNADGFSMASFHTENEGAENEYVFNDIEVTGYDSVDGHYYGHVFFSFYKPAEAAGAPRRAAEDDWSAVNNLVTYTPAEHLTMAQPGSTESLTLVRNKANTFTGMPNAFRVPSSHETGKAVNFTVKLTENGTPATMTVAGGIQTGVESVGVDADGEAEYYTLQGVRVAKPAAGIYLRRQGGTVSKVLVK